MKTKPIKISVSLKPYLNEIADKLWSQPSHATVMVGAGFSKNASNSFPSWVQLGDAFYEKISGEKPTNKDTQYANALKLADSVDAVFGRPALDSLLVNNIPDLTVEPSPLHEELLTFPWSDIFTTNYDTLLERAAGNVVEYRYDVVVNSHELINSTQPRIIKLHGSFPTAKPFIITEEDYRTYPSKFAPFVNTVQQSLLENTLCLIGFSGDDPNFLKWIGWIRDNLGENNSLRIYLIGVFNFSDADKALLQKRNIIAVDMFSCEGIREHDHYKALDLFFNYLREKKNQEVDLEWPEGMRLPAFDRDKDKSPQLEAVCNILAKYRKTYPGWIVAPKKSRTKIENEVLRWCNVVSAGDDIGDKLIIRLLDELVWYSNIALYPIYDNFAELIISVTGKQNCKQSLFDVERSLARYYREEYQWSEYGNLMTRLADVHSDNHHIQYELCLGKMARLEFDELKKQLHSWKVPLEQPEWVLKKSALLAEIGDIDDAYILARDVLKYIRSQLNLSRLNENIRLLSLESFAMVHLGMMPRSGSDSTESIGSSSKRWNVLSSYKCDPYGEVEAFKLGLKSSDLPLQTKVIYDFPIGTTKTSHQLNHAASVARAYSYLRFFEEAGVPFRCGSYVVDSEATENSIALLGNLFPLMSLVFSVRFQSSKSIAKLLSRRNLLNISTTTATYASEILLKFWEKNLDNISLNKSTIERISTSIVEVLAYLSPVLHSDVNKNNYALVTELLSSGKIKFEDNTDLFFRLLSDNTPLRQSFELSEMALNMRFSDFNYFVKCHPIFRIEFPDSPKPEFNSDCLDYLLSLLDGGDEIKVRYSLSALLVIVRQYSIDNTQMVRISQGVISLYNSDIKWDNLGFLYCLPMLTVNKDKEQIIEAFRSEMEKLDIPISGASGGYRGYGEGLNFFYCLNSYLDNEELNVDEYNKITNKLITWWDSDKERLNDDKIRLFGSVEFEFRSRFKNLINTLKNVIFPSGGLVKYDEGTISNLHRVVKELEEFKFPVLTQKHQVLGLGVNSDEDSENKHFVGLNDESILSLSEGVFTSLSSVDETSTRDAIDTLEYWLKGEVSKIPSEMQIKCILQLSNKLLFLGGECLPRSLYAIHEIILKFEKHLPKIVLENYIATNSKIYKALRICSTDTQEVIGKTLLLRQTASRCAKNLVDGLELGKIEKEELSCWGDIKSDYFDFNDVNSYWL